MADTKYQTFKLSDRRVVEAMLAVAHDVELPASTKISVSITGAPNLELPLQEIQDSPQYQALTSADAALAHQIALHGYPQGHLIISRQATYDEASVRLQEQHVNADFAIKFLASIGKHLPTYGRTEATDKVLGDELAEFYRRREQGLIQLEAFSQELIERNTEFRDKLEREFVERQRRLEEQINVQRQTLEAEHAAKLCTLEEREQALQERVKELDDRESRHVRREIRRDLKKALADRSQRFELSASTVGKRRVIHGLFVVLLAVSLAMLWQFLPKTAEDYVAADFWVRVGKSAFAAIGFAMTAVFYIRWNDWWFRQHADEEFRLKRLELDIDRASWVVEMALEWSREKEAGPVPAAIMEGVTRNLFESPAVSRPMHPAEDALTALLGASAGAVVKMPGGSELRFDRRSKKVLDQTTTCD